jgi:hypothetical protein
MLKTLKIKSEDAEDSYCVSRYSKVLSCSAGSYLNTIYLLMITTLKQQIFFFAVDFVCYIQPVIF